MLRRFTLKAALLAVVAAFTALVAPAVARADAVTQWNLNASNALFVVAGQGPQASVPHLAMVHGAVYDAVNAIDGGHEGYLLTPRVAQPFDSKEAAAATAAYRVLLNIVPAQQAVLDAQYAVSLAAIPDGSSKKRGIAVGEAAAAAMIAARTDDGRFGAYRFPIGSGPGAWKPVLPAFVNDPNAWLKDVRPFLIKSGTQFRSDGPDKLTSKAYARDFAEVKSMGSATSTTRSADQTHAARYWAENPPATWSRIFRTISAQQSLSLVDNARLFAMLYLTAADALITVWNDKAHYLFWRPITAIREADTDGNPATTSDPDWLPLIPTPPYTEHSSGPLRPQRLVRGDVPGLLRHRRDRLDGHQQRRADAELHATSRRRSTRSSSARVWSGIHFRNADEQGAKIGRQVAKWRQRHFFDAVHSHDQDD